MVRSVIYYYEAAEARKAGQWQGGTFLRASQIVNAFPRSSCRREAAHFRRQRLAHIVHPPASGTVDERKACAIFYHHSNLAGANF
jgi:hypothetical protein